MQIENLEGFSAIRLSDLPGLDPVTVITRDIGPGQGSILVECYGQAWSAYWGGMGPRTVRQFVASCDDDYIVDRMQSGQKATKAQRAYLSRIIKAVIKGLGEAEQ